MTSDKLYSNDEIMKTYEQVHDLLLTRYVIKTYSSNKSDIRDVTLNDLKLHRVQRVLELGCGYGFFIEKLKNMLHEEAVIIGIDMVENNREPFLHSVASINYKGEFITGNTSIIKDMQDSSFDLIIASYSLYFFPHLIPSIARILKPDGVFIAITHSKYTLGEVTRFVAHCMDAMGIVHEDAITFNRLFHSFSGEDGEILLKKSFLDVERILYRNSMIFPYANIEDCIFYIQKKKNLLYKDVMEQTPERIHDIEKCVEQQIRNYTRTNGIIGLNKDDAVFRCYRPLM